MRSGVVKPAGTALVAALLVSLPAALEAVIERLYSLKEVLDQSTNVLAGKIDRIDRRNRIAVARIDRALKGEKEYATIQMNFSVGEPTEGRYLTELFTEGELFVLFYSRNGNEIASLAHAGDVWFQLFAAHEKNTSKVWWRFTHIEVHMGRTFNGPTEDFLRVTGEVLADRRTPPAPDPKVPTFELAKAPRPGQRRRPGQAAGPAPITLIRPGGPWKYLKGGAAPPRGKDGTPWMSARFDDTAWTAGAAPFGYGDEPYGTALADMRRSGSGPGYSSLYLRCRFDVKEPAAIRELAFDVNYDDGFILWLNGKRAAAANAPPDAPAHDAVAPASHESGAFERFDLEHPAELLVKGENVAALQVFNRDLESSDLKIDVEATARVAVQAPGRGGFRKLFEMEAPAAAEVRGISWADADGDARLDALFCRGGGNVLLLNQPGEWRASGSGVAAEGSRSAGWADVDGDGKADLLTSGFRLLRGGSPEMISRRFPAPPARNPEGAGWIDADGDGLPDALITNGEHGVLLYRNQGKSGERFADASDAAGLGQGGLGKGNGDFVAFADVDGDGATDFLYNLGGGVLALNTGGSFRPAPRSGIELPDGDRWKRGAAFADYDNDMDLDLFVPAPGRPRLYRNENDGTFTDVLERSGALAESAAPSCSCAWGDVDGDGFLDLLVCRPEAPAGLYLGDGRGRFRDAGDRLPAAAPPAFAASFADVDGDGDLDLASNHAHGVLIAINEIERDPARGAVTVRVLARKGLIGAVVRAYAPDGRRLGLRQLALAQGWGGQEPGSAHLAMPLGPCEVTVCLSDGRMARKPVKVEAGGVVVTLRDEEFED